MQKESEIAGGLPISGQVDEGIMEVERQVRGRRRSCYAFLLKASYSNCVFCNRVNSFFGPWKKLSKPKLETSRTMIGRYVPAAKGSRKTRLYAS